MRKELLVEPLSCKDCHRDQFTRTKVEAGTTENGTVNVPQDPLRQKRGDGLESLENDRGLFSIYSQEGLLPTDM